MEIRDEVSHRRALVVWTVAGVLVMVHAALAWHLRTASILYWNDDAIYVLLSRSLRAGGYYSTYLAGAPFHSTYPPLYPALLSLLSAIFGESITVFQIAGIALSVAALLLAFDVVRRRWSPALALMVLAILAVNPDLTLEVGRVMSEALFMALLMLALWALARRPLTPAAIAVGGIAAIASAFTRTLGVSVVFAVLAYLLVERRWRAAAVFGGVIAALALSALAVVALTWGAGSEYTYLTDYLSVLRGAGGEGFGAFVARMVANARNYETYLYPGVIPVPLIGDTLVDNYAWAAVFVIGLSVGLITLSRRWPVAALVIVCYGLVLAMWFPVPRLLEPVLPLLITMLLGGAAALAWRAPPRAALVLPGALAIVLVASALARDAELVRQQKRCDRGDPLRSVACHNFGLVALPFFEAARFAAHAIPDTAIFLVGKDGAFNYFSGRKATTFRAPLAREGQAFLDFLASLSVDYIVFGYTGPEDDRLLKRLRPVCDRLEIVREFPPTATIFRVSPSAKSDPMSASCVSLARDPAVVLKVPPDYFTSDAGSVAPSMSAER